VGYLEKKAGPLVGEKAFTLLGDVPLGRGVVDLGRAGRACRWGERLARRGGQRHLCLKTSSRGGEWTILVLPGCTLPVEREAIILSKDEDSKGEFFLLRGKTEALPKWRRSGEGKVPLHEGSWSTSGVGLYLKKGVSAKAIFPTRVCHRKQGGRLCVGQKKPYGRLTEKRGIHRRMVRPGCCRTVSRQERRWP